MNPDPPLSAKKVEMGAIATTLLVIAGAYAAFVGYLYIVQGRLLYLPQIPSRAIVATPAEAGLTYEAVTLHTDDGVTLDAWFVPTPRPLATVIFCHGNAGNISHRLDTLKVLNELGLSTLIFDYRGYGRSQGNPSEKGTYRDGSAAWRYLTEERGVREQEIVLFGRSLGGAVAAHLAEHHTPAALILESTFTSVPDLAATLYPFLPARLLARFRYDAETSLHAITRPVLVIHSREDEIIPFEHGRALYAAAREPKRFLELHGSHNEAFFSGREHYMQGLREFLAAHLQR